MIDGVVAVTGRTGQGKGLCSVGLARDYLAAGRKVVTNMDLNPENFKDKNNKKIRLYRIPDTITIDVLKELQAGGSIGPGNLKPQYGDENGLLLLDEVGVFLNSQDWNKPHARPVVDWLRHRRKHGWDIAMQIQDIDSLNSQVRRAVIDYEMRAIKVVSIPVISTLYRMILKKRFKLPVALRYHKAAMKNLETDLIEDSFRYRGEEIYPLYDTTQVISDDYPHGIHCMLTPWHLVGRYGNPPFRLFAFLWRCFAFVIFLFSSLYCRRSRFFIKKVIKKSS